MDIAAEKLRLMNGWWKLDNPSVLAELITMRERLSTDADWWDELSAEDVAAVQEGLRQLEAGEYQSHEQVRDEVKRKFGF